LSAPTSPVLAAIFVGDDDDDDDKPTASAAHQRLPALFDHRAAAAKRIGSRMPMSMPPLPPFPLTNGKKGHHPASPSLTPAFLLTPPPLPPP